MSALGSMFNSVVNAFRGVGIDLGNQLVHVPEAGAEHARVGSAVTYGGEGQGIGFGYEALRLLPAPDCEWDCLEEEEDAQEVQEARVCGEVVGEHQNDGCVELAPQPVLDSPNISKPGKKKVTLVHQRKKSIEVVTAFHARKPHLNTLSVMSAKDIDWEWKGIFPLGNITVIHGPAGVGKSTLTAYIASVVSTGGMWPDGSMAPKGDVLFINCEDSLEHVVKRRLENHGAAQKRIHSTGGHIPLSELPETIGTILKAYPQIKVIVNEGLMDELSSVGTSKASKMLTIIQEIAKTYSVAIITVAHERKGDSGSLNSIIGTSAIGNAVRVAWCLARDPFYPTCLLFTNTKNNLAPMADGFACSIVGGKLVWEKDRVPRFSYTHEAGEIEAVVEEPSPIVDFLQVELAAGAVKSTEIFSLGKKEGFSASQLSRAATKMGVIRGKEQVFGGAWYWRLPDADVNDEIGEK